MTVISITDRRDTSGLVYISVGDATNSNAREDFAVSPSEWKKLSSSYGITELIPLTEEMYTDIKDAAERTSAVRRAAGILSRGDKSAAELKSKLCHAGISKESAEHAVELLRRRGYIDEEAQCARIAESLLRSKRYGRGRIVTYLISHGYPPETAKNAAASLNGEDIASALSATIQKKFPDISEYAPADTKKAVASLMRLGFSSGEIFAEIRRLKNNKD